MNTNCYLHYSAVGALVGFFYLTEKFIIPMKTIFSVTAFLFLFAACHPGTGESSGSRQETGMISQDTVSNKPHADTAYTTIQSDRAIIPGKRIGKTFLLEDAERLSKILGKPDYSDAAMGKAWLTWFGKKRDEHNNRTELNVYTTYKDTSMTSKVVKQIRTTSSWFVLKNNIHVYSDFSAVQNAFPGLEYSGKYRDGDREIKLYDDIRQGIAFEIVTANRQQICIGIIIHEPGDPVTATYIPLHQDIMSE